MEFRKAKKILRPFCKSKEWNGPGTIYVFNGLAVSTDRAIMAVIPVDEDNSDDLPKYCEKAECLIGEVDPDKCTISVKKIEPDAFFSDDGKDYVFVDGYAYSRKYIAMIGKLRGAKRGKPLSQLKGHLPFVVQHGVRGMLAPIVVQHGVRGMLAPRGNPGGSPYRKKDEALGT